jgi:hypothetical protein
MYLLIFGVILLSVIIFWFLISLEYTEDTHNKDYVNELLSRKNDGLSLGTELLFWYKRDGGCVTMSGYVHGITGLGEILVYNDYLNRILRLTKRNGKYFCY